MKHTQTLPSPRTGLLAATALILGLFQTGPSPALAGPLDLPGGCAVGRGDLHGSGSHIAVDRVDVALPGQPDASFRAAHLDAASRGAALPPGALQQASTAAAAALLVSISGHRDGACSDQAFRQATAPLAQAVASGGHASFAWTGVSVRSGDKHVGAQRLTVRLDGSGPDATLTLALDGVVSNDPAAGLLPDSLHVTAALPATEIPALLSAAGGHGAPVDVRIESLQAKRGPSTLDGTGQARIAADPSDSSGTGHVVVHDYDALLDAASAPGLEKLRTALFLARLMAHHQGDASDWDIAWQGHTLTVNNVPLPIR